MNKTILILLSKNTPTDIIERARSLSPEVELLFNEDTNLHPEKLAHVEIVYGSMLQNQWSAMPKLKWVQTTGAGVDWLLTPEAKAYPAFITNARIHGQCIAEHLFGLLLCLQRGLHIAVRNQSSHLWEDTGPFGTLIGQTLGLLGVGVIGSRTAEIARAFGMRVIGLRRTGTSLPFLEKMYLSEQKIEMLSQCDVVINTLPLTEKTHHFLGAPEFNAMKQAALFLNIGRGGTVDTNALVEALQCGHLGGAGLDVTDPEPLPADHPLWGMKNVIITPHVAGIHPQYSAHAGELFLENLRRYVAGEALLNLVNKEEGY
jgi:phosphoglycerate dehydrogenase-like enzyme